MTIHLCRDFLTDTTASCPGTNMYALGMFLMHVGGFNVIGQTNFDLEVTASVGQGISGTINMGFGSNEVFLPTASYLVSTQDVGRILALKSQLYPLANSGLFRVTSVDIPNNCLVIDYRASSTPPAEQFLAWRVFINEAAFAQYWRTGSNGTVNYGSWNPNTSSLSNASRVVLRSLDESSWEVRMCLESSHDLGSVPSGFSIAPGFGGDGDGDFQELDSGVSIGKRIFTHAALWYDTTSSIYRGMTVGLSPAYNVNGQWRISMIIDDVSGTCGIVNHNVSLPTVAFTSGSGWCVFGLAEDETEIPADTNLSDPGITGQRLFVAGSSNPHAKLTWQTQFHADNVTQVVGWSKLGYPVAGVLSLYSDISNPSNSHTRYITSSVDNVWNTQTELLDADVLLGTVDVTDAASTTIPLFPLQPRRLGRLPFFRQGRANFTQWKLTGDHNWYHTEDGVFMPWGGPSPTDAEGAIHAVTVTSSSIELQQGLDPLGAFLPGSDPPVPVLPPNILDVDATRFRKTYSYFRQVPVNVGVQKGGSNPAKP